MALMEVHPQSIVKRLERIEKMQGSDPGFALIALLSFVESFAREYTDDFSPRATLPELLQNFGELQFGSRRYTLANDRQRMELLRYQKLANKVRHHFASVSAEEYQAALSQLFLFLKSLNIDDARLNEQMAKIEDALTVWGSRKSHYQDFNELMETGFRLAKSMQENAKLRGELEEQLKTSASSGTDELAEEAYASAAPPMEYLEGIRRLSMYARSFRDFQRRLIEPSPEQEQVIQRVRSEGSFLVSGSAGTGKTLVLILAMKRYVQQFGSQLNFDSHGAQLLLLTYTSTLTKYNRYLSSLVSPGPLALSYATVDSFLNNMVEQHLGDRTIIYDRRQLSSLFRNAMFEGCSIDPKLAFEEVEQYLLAHNIPRELYIDEAMTRRGRQQQLSQHQRKEIWRIRDAFCQVMEDRHQYSRNFGRIRLIEILQQRMQNGAYKAEYRKIFVDEIQDLNRADLQVLGLLSAQGLVMAGDRDQSIFLSGFSFESAGINLNRSNSAVLKQNFRNSRPIHHFAASLRRESSNGHAAFRDGPPVEVFRHKTRKDSLARICDRVALVLGDLGYSAQSSVILAPRGEDLRQLRDALSERGIESCSVKDSRFDFRSSAGIRLSTLHSVKGLDFASVLVWIPEDIYTGPTPDEELEQNLLYVASSRAMELLWFFTVDPAMFEKLAGHLPDAEEQGLEALHDTSELIH